MSIQKLLNSALALIIEIPRQDFPNFGKCRLWADGTCGAVSDFESYIRIIDELFTSNEKLAIRFSREKVLNLIDKNIFDQWKLKEEFSTTVADSFFEELLSVKPTVHQVVAPISGIRLDKSSKEFELSIFKIGLLSALEFPITNGDGHYIKISITQSYDELLAIEKANSVYDDFARLIIFISGKSDKSIQIKTGLPLWPNAGPEQMYVDSASFQILDKDGQLLHGKASARYVERVPVDNDFFCANPVFSKLWIIYQKKHAGIGLTDMQKRIVNAALALGESTRSEDVKNSVIYSCIALETLFSFDEGAMFQKSIADKMADAFVFVVGKDLDSRMRASKLLKNVYRMRSALVHGGDKKINNDYVAINILLRAAIAELLNNVKYTNASKVDDIHKMVRDSQYSY